MDNTTENTANALLAPYDWYIIRKLEEGKDIPGAVSKYRDDVRTACAARETQINAVIDVTSLKDLVDSSLTAWPDAPS